MAAGVAVTKERLSRLLRLSFLAAEGGIPSASESWKHLHELTAEFEAWEPEDEREEAQQRETLLADTLEEATRYGEAALRAIDEARAEVQRLRTVLRVVEKRLQGWLDLPTGTRRMGLLNYIADVLEPEQ